MEDQTLLIETLFEKSKEYTKSSVELFRLKAVEKFADVMSTFTARLTVILVISLFLLILNVALALWIGELLGRFSYGFFIAAGFYGLVGIVLYIFRNKLIKVPVQNLIITQVLK